MSRKIAIVGLGYVGLQTAIAFGAKYPVLGFDVDLKRIEDLEKSYDEHHEVTPTDLNHSNIEFTSDPTRLADYDFFIIVVPTPVKKSKEPDFSYLISASELVGQFIKPGDIVVYESTVYPGATEEICLPVLEEASGLTLKNFSLGYSPERINPGDGVHLFSNTKKVISASNKKTLDILEKVYGDVVEAGVYRVSSIKVAEAVKVIENIQRDVNIAVMNELTQVLHKMDIDMQEVLEAAKTKWNFIPVTPGFVGGHCIGVDPYYFIYKANEMNCDPELITDARKVNEEMPQYVADEAVKLLLKNNLYHSLKVAVLGITYKENFPDIRNSKIVDLIKKLQDLQIKVYVHDPVADETLVAHEYGIRIKTWKEIPTVSAVIVAVAHDEFSRISPQEFSEKLVTDGIVMDLKSVLNAKALEERGLTVWRL